MKVVLSAGARRDLDEIGIELRRRAGTDIAVRVIGELRERTRNLASFPERGNVPPELEAVSGLDYRELHHAPYRIIYRLVADTVEIALVADGRRDFRKLLAMRLLRP
ncbi:MAG: type II toxin-antitoxin system RelE/ParE family toxin [Geminicoccaceae bacterium]|nr:MAG: type II toxin-antitoxin system RelE/ParE family toxin [Geminicoccaceae bacterium]